MAKVSLQNGDGPPRKKRISPRIVLVVVDTETTGLGHVNPSGPREDGIVQVGLAWRDRRGTLRGWERTCNPGSRYLKDGRAAEALAVNGLTESVVQRAVTSEVASAELSRKLAEISGEDGRVELRAFNVGFDRPFLETPPWEIAAAWGACLMVEAATAFGSPSGRIPLRRACANAGVVVADRMHTAGVDARLALEVHEFIDRQRQHPPSPLGSMSHHPGCEVGERHDGPCGYFAEGDFYELE